MTEAQHSPRTPADTETENFATPNEGARVRMPHMLVLIFRPTLIHLWKCKHHVKYN